MHADDLRAFDDFAALDSDALTTLERNSRLICVPAKRWLARSRRKLKGRFYLVEGCVEVDGKPVTAPWGKRLYPGCKSLRSRDPSVLLQVDWESLEFLFATQPDATAELSSGWEEAFLASPLMQKLPWSGWQRVLSSLTRRRVHRGDVIARLGDQPAQVCYVLAEGRAMRSGCELCAGELFGEVALVARAPYQYTVTMTTAGVVLLMPETVLVDVVLADAVPILRSAEDRLPIDIGRAPSGVGLWVPEAELHAASLDPDASYAIASGTPMQRLLAALCLVSLGFDACVVLQAGTVRPSAQRRKLEIDSECSTDIG